MSGRIKVTVVQTNDGRILWGDALRKHFKETGNIWEEVVDLTMEEVRQMGYDVGPEC